jgi:hypothetical protein
MITLTTLQCLRETNLHIQTVKYIEYCKKQTYLKFYYYQIVKILTIKQKTPQESLSCCLECFKVETFHRFICGWPFNFKNVLKNKNNLPGLGKITIVYFYLSTGIMTLKMIFVLNEMCLFWKYHRCKHINEKKMKKGAGIIFLRRIIRAMIYKG